MASSQTTTSSVKPVSRLMQGVTVAVAGNLGPGWSDADVARWLAYHGGRFAPTLTGDVTHVLCTREAYDKPRAEQNPELRAALDAAGHGTARSGPYVVLRDWLEDSLHKHRRRREAPYLLQRVCRAQRDAAAAALAAERRLARRRAQGLRQAETFINTTLYRVYRDRSGLAYRATLRRDHPAAGVFGERYILELFESIARPPLYWFAARHYKSRKHTQPRVFRPSRTCQLFATEHAHFCAFFRRKTGVAWEARLVDRGPAPEADTAADAALPSPYFTYDRPAEGGR